MNHFNYAFSDEMVLNFVVRLRTSVINDYIDLSEYEFNKPEDMENLGVSSDDPHYYLIVLGKNLIKFMKGVLTYVETQCMNQGDSDVTSTQNVVMQISDVPHLQEKKSDRSNRKFMTIIQNASMVVKSMINMKNQNASTSRVLDLEENERSYHSILSEEESESDNDSTTSDEENVIYEPRKSKAPPRNVSTASAIRPVGAAAGFSVTTDTVIGVDVFKTILNEDQIELKTFNSTPINEESAAILNDSKRTNKKHKNRRSRKSKVNHRETTDEMPIYYLDDYISNFSNYVVKVVKDDDTNQSQIEKLEKSDASLEENKMSDRSDLYFMTLAKNVSSFMKGILTHVENRYIKSDHAMLINEEDSDSTTPGRSKKSKGSYPSRHISSQDICVISTFLVFVIVIIGWISSSLIKTDSSQCMTADNLPGTCMEVNNCSRMISGVAFDDSFDPMDIQSMLDLNKCGDASIPKVCCSLEKMSPPNFISHKNLKLLPENCGQTMDARIAMGSATGLFQYPWMALIIQSINGSLVQGCGGTIINERYILTAAHCVAKLGQGITVASVRVGDHDILSEFDCEGIDDYRYCAPQPQEFETLEVIPHHDYNPATRQKDIALIRLDSKIELLDSVQPICLPTTQRMASIELSTRSMTVVGWGLTEYNYTSDILLEAEVLVISNDLCARTYKWFGIDTTHICAAGPNGEDTCNGDSGGPLKVLTWKHPTMAMVQYGIISVGPKKCGVDRMPAIYTRITSYMDWILDNIRP